MIRNAIDQQITPMETTRQMLNKAAKEILGKNLEHNLGTAKIRKVLHPNHFVRTRSTPGSTHPDEVRRMAEDRKIRLKREGAWTKDREAKIRNSYQKLRHIAQAFAQGSA
jgi:hypothetical protein